MTQTIAVPSDYWRSWGSFTPLSNLFSSISSLELLYHVMNCYKSLLGMRTVSSPAVSHVQPSQKLPLMFLSASYSKAKMRLLHRLPYVFVRAHLFLVLSVEMSYANTRDNAIINQSLFESIPQWTLADAFKSCLISLIINHTDSLTRRIILSSPWRF